MPQFSKYYSLELSQHELDFVDISNEYDTRVYVDPYAIEIQDDPWSCEATDFIRDFFQQLLDALRTKDMGRAANLMSHLHEPRETFLGLSRATPQGRGVGSGQARQLISAIVNSRAYKTGLLTDLSEMALFVEGIDRDKISDLTTNIIRTKLVEYTKLQCDLFDIPIKHYNGPPFWDINRHNWVSRNCTLPYIDNDPVLLVPKHIVRKQLSLDSQEFYNKHITDFLVAENLRASSSLVQTIKGQQKVYKKDVREQSPKSKQFISDIVKQHPELLYMYKEIARLHGVLSVFNDSVQTIYTICAILADLFKEVPTGAKSASKYHKLVLGALTSLFFPSLILPHKEWEIHDGRKRIDIVYSNASDNTKPR